MLAGILQAAGSASEYMTDAFQRTVLFWDVMRQRSNQYTAQKAKSVPNVLSFESELVLNGRNFRNPSTTVWSASFLRKVW